MTDDIWAGPEDEWGDGSSGADLLEQVRAALTKYVVLPNAVAADAVTLWVAATHAQPSWAHAPRLVIKAPEKRCGKSRLLDVIEATCHNALITVNASPAAVYRAIDGNDPPTLLVDEADAIFGSKKQQEANEDLRSLLNAGHQRNRPALRWDIQARRLDTLQTFAMAALAGIGSMPDTIEDRAVIIHMRRRAAGEHVAPYRHRRDAFPLHDLRDQIAGWLREHMEKLQDAEPEMPVEDRAADNWEPLVAVADLAGGTWPQRARAAAVAMTKEQEDSTRSSDKLRLLADCKSVFAGEIALRSSVLVEKLKADDEAPWDKFGKNGLTSNSLADMLREYDIRSKNVRFTDGSQAKGYVRNDFLDAWNRYCAGDPSPSQPSQPHQSRSERDGTLPWDGSNRPNDVPGSAGTAGTAGTADIRTEDGSTLDLTVSDPPDDWDGSSRPSTPSRPSLTSTDEVGTAGTAPRHETGIATQGDPCQACGTPMSAMRSAYAEICVDCIDRSTVVKS